MTERKEETGRQRPLSLLHQFSDNIINRRDVVGINGVAQAEHIGQEGCSKKGGLVAKLRERPNPRCQIDRTEHQAQTYQLGPVGLGTIVE